MFTKIKSIKKKEELIALINNYPESNHLLDLSGNSLLQIENNSVYGNFYFIPRSTLDKTILLLAVLSAIPSSVNELKLNSLEIGQRSADEIILIFEAIPKHIKHLSLKSNFLSQFTTEKNNSDSICLNIINAFPKHLVSLDLSNNLLGMVSKERLIPLMKALPSGLKSLKLSDNSLDYKDSPVLIEVFKALPKQLKYLYLDGNSFQSKSRLEVVNMLNALPSSLIYLDISNNFRKGSIYETLEELIDKLASHIQEAIGGRALIEPSNKTAVWAHKLDNFLLNHSGLYSKKPHFKSLNLPFKLNEKKLEKLVHGLEYTDYPLYLYLAGLLLEGFIPTEIKRDLSRSEEKVYWEKRTHDAIRLYMKAGQFGNFPLADIQLLDILASAKFASTTKFLKQLSLEKNDIVLPIPNKSKLTNKML